MKSLFENVENIVGKGENAGSNHFSFPFANNFLTLYDTVQTSS